MKLNVFYDCEFIDQELDRKIIEAFKELGFRCWASGYNLVEKKRDLAFDTALKEKD